MQEYVTECMQYKGEENHDGKSKYLSAMQACQQYWNHRMDACQSAAACSCLALSVCNNKLTSSSLLAWTQLFLTLHSCLHTAVVIVVPLQAA